MSRSFSSAVRTVALVVTGAAAYSLPPLPAFAQTAQQVTISADFAAQCAHIREPGQNAQCHYDRRLAYERALTMAAKTEGNCADKIKAEIAAGRITPEALRNVLAGRPAREVGACNILNALTRS